MTTIMGIQIGNREEDAIAVQALLTKHGCLIKTRLGLHDAGNMCSSSGLVLLEFVKGNEAEVELLRKELSEMHSVSVGVMSI